MSRRQRRVLFITQNDWFFHLHFLPLAAEFQRRGCQVHLACRVNQHASELRQHGITVHALGRLQVENMQPLVEAGLLLELIRLVRRLKPELLFTISMRPMLHGSLLARIFRTPAAHLVTGLGFLFTGDTERQSRLRRLVLLALRLTLNDRRQSLLFQNREDLETFHGAGLGRPAQSHMVGGVGTDTQRFQPGEKAATPPVIVAGMRLLRDKGVLEYVEAARLLRRWGLDFRALLAGKPDLGNPSSLTLEEVQALKDEGAVEVLGFREDIEEVLAGADIACLPSYREGFPKFLLDAGAAGCALVATNVPGCREIVRHEETGLLAAPRDGASLATALKRLIEDPALRGELAERARREILEQHTPERFARRCYEVASSLG